MKDVVIPTSQMKKLSVREKKQLSFSHTAKDVWKEGPVYHSVTVSNHALSRRMAFHSELKKSE